MGPGSAELLTTLTTASPIGLFAIFIVALLRRWLVLPREVDDRQRRIEELIEERDEYKDMAFRALDIGERLTTKSETTTTHRRDRG